MNDCERGDINTVCQECACIFWGSARGLVIERCEAWPT